MTLMFENIQNQEQPRFAPKRDGGVFVRKGMM